MGESVMTNRTCLHHWLALVSLVVGPAAYADDDHEKARMLQQENEILSLEAILERLPAASDSRLLELELEHEQGTWVYEIEMLHPDGRVREYEVDAVTGEVLSVENEDD